MKYGKNLYKFLIVFFIAFIVVGCGNHSCNKASANQIIVPLPNSGGATLVIPLANMAIPENATNTSTAIVIQGGDKDSQFDLNATVTLNLKKSGMDSSIQETSPFLVTFSPQSILAQGNGTESASTMDIVVQHEVPLGNYNINLVVSYAGNNVPVTIPLVVDSSNHTIQDGNLATTLAQTVIHQNESVSAIISLNNSVGVGSTEVDLSATGNVVDISPSSCTISTNNPQCTVIITGHGVGNALISASALGYETASQSVQVVPDSFGNLVINPDKVTLVTDFQESAIMTVSLVGSTNVESFTAQLSLLQDNQYVRLSKNSCSLSSETPLCEFKVESALGQGSAVLKVSAPNYQEQTADITVVGAPWEYVGSNGSSLTNNGATQLSMAYDSNNIPYVAFGDANYGYALSIMKYNGTSWVYVGQPGFGGQQSYWFSIAFKHNDSSNTPYVAFQDGSAADKLSVISFNGSKWNYVGNPGFSPSFGGYINLRFNNSNIPYVSFMDSMGPIDGVPNFQGASVMTYQNAAWQLVGPRNFTNTQTRFNSLAIGTDNTLYVALQESQAPYYNGALYKFTNSSSGWESVGNNFPVNAPATQLSIALDSNNTPYVAFKDGSANEELSVVKFSSGSGSAEYVGAPGSASSNDVLQIGVNTSIAINPITQTPYVIYSAGCLDGLCDGFVSGYSQDIGWFNLVTPSGFSNGAVMNNLSLMFIENTPYISYQSSKSNYSASVMKFYR